MMHVFVLEIMCLFFVVLCLTPHEHVWKNIGWNYCRIGFQKIYCFGSCGVFFAHWTAHVLPEEHGLNPLDAIWDTEKLREAMKKDEVMTLCAVITLRWRCCDSEWTLCWFLGMEDRCCTETGSACKGLNSALKKKTGTWTCFFLQGTQWMLKATFSSDSSIDRTIGFAGPDGGQIKSESKDLPFR